MLFRSIVLSDDFSNPDLDVRWYRQDLAGRATRYSIVNENNNPILSSHADRSASALLRPVRTHAPGVVLSWRWRIEVGLWDNHNEQTRPGDDFAARLFVIFGNLLGDPDIRALCYVWAASEPPM